MAGRELRALIAVGLVNKYKPSLLMSVFSGSSSEKKDSKWPTKYVFLGKLRSYFHPYVECYLLHVKVV